MKSLMLSVVAAGLAASFAAGCAAGSDDPAESSVSSDVTVGAWNYVLSCTPLALRTCDNPGACDTGVRMAYRSQVFVDAMDWNTRMAHLSSPSGWARADGTDGDPYLSVNLTPSCL
jgi:hypothetical protein